LKSLGTTVFHNDLDRLYIIDIDTTKRISDSYKLGHRNHSVQV